MKLRILTDYLDSILLPVYQENYDNAGLIVGDLDSDVHSALVSLDVTPTVVDEAIAINADIIVSHHPLIFGGIKKITSNNATGHMLLRLAQHNIAVYAAHTNLDNMEWGVNGILADRLGLNDRHILRPLGGVLGKVITYVPRDYADRIRQTLFSVGAGCIGSYDHCSFNSDGVGTFRAGDGCNPFCGTIGEEHHENETRIEAIYEHRIEHVMLQQLRKAHPYEEPVIDLMPLCNPHPHIGAGLVGKLSDPLSTHDFLLKVKELLHLPTIRISSASEQRLALPVATVALCGGAGSFLIGDARACGADIYLTADLKYHDFPTDDNHLIVADIGHYESEQFAKDLLHKIISEKFTNFACRISEQGNSFVQYI